MSNAVPNTDEKIYLWFDIDNTLYSRTAGINELMGKLIHDYFVSLGMSEEDAHALHMRYYTDYGLAIRGLVRHHRIDAIDYDSRCDGALPLEGLISSSPALSQLFDDIDLEKANIWALTNAYKTHASRVLELLDLKKHIQGLVFCNYADPDFTCKPEKDFYIIALEQAGNPHPSKCYFVDDSLANVQAAKALGWGSCVYFQELVASEVPVNASAVGVDHVIHSIEELRTVWRQVFKMT